MDKEQFLCHLCASYLHLDRCCPFCDQIYRQGDTDCFDGKAWLECSTCLRWVHAKCEEANGLTQAMAIYERSKKGVPSWYLCPDCCVSRKESGDFCYDLFVHQYSQLKVAAGSEGATINSSDPNTKGNMLDLEELLVSKDETMNLSSEGVAMSGIGRIIGVGQDSKKLSPLLELPRINTEPGLGRVASASAETETPGRKRKGSLLGLHGEGPGGLKTRRVMCA